MIKLRSEINAVFYIIHHYYVAPLNRLIINLIWTIWFYFKYILNISDTYCGDNFNKYLYIYIYNEILCTVWDAYTCAPFAIKQPMEHRAPTLWYDYCNCRYLTNCRLFWFQNCGVKNIIHINLRLLLGNTMIIKVLCTNLTPLCHICWRVHSSTMKYI